MTSSARHTASVVSSVAPDGATVLRVTGAFDEGIAHLIEERVKTLDANSPLVLNLGAVVYLSSTGIGEIVHLASRFRLVLAEPNEGVEKILGLAEVWSLLDVGASEEEALALSRQQV